MAGWLTDMMEICLSWCWTGRPGVLQFMGSQRVRHDCASEVYHKCIISEVS